MSTIDEKPTGLHNVDIHDDQPNVDHVVHIAHETEGKTSPWTWPMIRLYLVLAVAYLCGYVITLFRQMETSERKRNLIIFSTSGIADVLPAA